MAPGLRFVAPDSSSAWCEAGEVMVSAFCVGGGNSAPVTIYPNGAKCGYGDSASQARILCMPAAEQQGAAPGTGGASMQAAAMPSGLRLVSTGSNTASCEPGEALFSAYCTGGWSDYPLITYAGGRVKCGYSGEMADANAVCMPGGEGAAAALGLRVVASDTNTAWCESGESMVSAYCTGGWSEYPLQTYANGAKCGYSNGNATATIVCRAADASDEMLRVVSDGIRSSCESNEVMVSAFCSGSGRDYPLQTVSNGAKCGYSGDSAVATVVCLAR
jgi:hypothetical protein